VNIGLGLVLVLLGLVAGGIKGSVGTGVERSIVVLGDLLLGLLGSLAGVTLDRLGDVLAEVLDRVDGGVDNVRHVGGVWG
jgi:hypothetical protein